MTTSETKLLPGQRFVVAIDLGGTQCRAVLANQFGLLAGNVVLATDPSAEGLRQQIVATVRQFQHEAASRHGLVEQLCIGFPGVVHPFTQQISQAPNITGIEDVALADQLTRQLGIPVHLENDVNLAALAEFQARRDENVESLAFIAIGTGLGVGLVLNGALWRGFDGGAGELCKLPMSRTSQHFIQSIGDDSATIEDLVSGKGMAKAYGQRLGCAGADLDHRQVRDIFSKAAQGFTPAQETLAAVARECAYAIEQLEYIVNPQIYVLGGGVGSRPEMLSAVNQNLAERGIEIHPSRFNRTHDTSASATPQQFGAGLAGALISALEKCSAPQIATEDAVRPALNVAF